VSEDGEIVLAADAASEARRSWHIAADWCEVFGPVIYAEVDARLRAHALAERARLDALVDAGAGAPTPFGAATEASFFAEHAPTVVFGPGNLADDDGAVAHSEREYVHLSDVEATAAAVQTALDELV
jgi:acetylornithine deacetylase/succinyl-diaminopimelate desuccinylase-like protein